MSENNEEKIVFKVPNGDIYCALICPHDCIFMKNNCTKIFGINHIIEEDNFDLSILVTKEQLNKFKSRLDFMESGPNKKIIIDTLNNIGGN